MKYRHRWLSGDRINLPTGKIVCVGRNYAEHVEELNNPLPDDPVLFIKPVSSAVHLELPFKIPQDRGDVHFETEIALLIDKPLCNASEHEATSAIKALGLALDLTLRDLQSKMKSKGLPWEIAKAFDGSCPISSFVAKEHLPNLDSIEFSLKVNGEVRQQDTSAHMLTSIPGLLSFISRHFTLEPGDIVLSGTPKGVAPLYAGDQLELTIKNVFSIETTCKAF
ncbi:5-carboxymethyl-2-hydroxymuconate delta-isomerase [Endozoicomonas montiporae]|uniref:5-carboxymethyl-2-hydroxymuconate delta-isomerase n=2 Tax=Endozoicomonas montiporae TaxID=1027273 RepID=A0A081N0P5_9GAMM|nr:fumarylacetoacetate hydrolase family protein [Endozoicomonas montiporae]AMO54492.1 fumarylacetoacetate hydrolase family protein [Endozoicomonas montiporae CL-33]KEQ12018.1 5-carboxymethyl-2-hydroxymuconate delta-isomerase [Endozoicomonas montiporae]